MAKEKMIKIDDCVVKEMISESLELLKTGDIVIFKDVMYIDTHATAARQIAEPLYAIFKKWAVANNIPLTYKNFYRVYFSALGHLNAYKKAQVRVNRNDMGVYVLANDGQKNLLN